MSSLYLLPSADPLTIEGGNTEETYTQEKDTTKYITERKGEGKGLGKGEGGREGGREREERRTEENRRRKEGEGKEGSGVIQVPHNMLP